MCGINLVLNYPDLGKRAISNMMEATRHRGPDQSDWKQLSDGMFIAGNRLKTVDLSDWPNQPVTIEDNYHLVWNGALYNADELRNLLLTEGESFESRSDAEVLAKWLKQKGSEGIRDLQGMFALVFVDKVRQKVFIARDQYGKKPVYYYRRNNQWIVSSEAKAIAFSGLVKREIDEAQFLPYYYSRHSFPDYSFFKGIRQVLPGKVLELDWEGNILEEKVLAHSLGQDIIPDKKYFKTVLTDAVLKHFQADVPVGILLSGGADSSLLLHTWVQETGIPLHTFTVTFEDKYLREFQDPTYAWQISKKYNCAHHEVLITPETVLDNWDEYINSLDQPVGDSASFISWMIAREAKKHVKILISGAGADELFGGYNRHEAFRFYLKHKNVLQKWGGLGNKFPFAGRSLRKFSQAIDDSDQATFLNFSALHAIPKDVQSVFLSYYPNEKNPYKAALMWDRDYYLINDVLKVHDNALMAHGVEGRAPYLDKGIVELSNAMSEQQHLKHKPKQWIRELLEEAGLEEHAKRKKLGFGLPLSNWLSREKNFSGLVFDAIRSFGNEWGALIPQEMRKLVYLPEEHIKDDFLQIWNLFILSSWCKKNQL